MSRSPRRFSRRGPIWTDPELYRDNPEGLRRLDPLTGGFERARGPLIDAQLRDMKKTEAQRREESGRGSMMVKLHKPFPELRPKHENAPLRNAFNQAWMREHREARLVQLQKQREAMNANAPENSREQKPGLVQEPRR